MACSIRSHSARCLSADSRPVVVAHAETNSPTAAVMMIGFFMTRSLFGDVSGLRSQYSRCEQAEGWIAGSQPLLNSGTRAPWSIDATANSVTWVDPLAGEPTHNPLSTAFDARCTVRCGSHHAGSGSSPTCPVTRRTDCRTGDNRECDTGLQQVRRSAPCSVSPLATAQPARTATPSTLLLKLPLRRCTTSC